MSQQDNFVGGFFLGALIGGALGGVIGVLATRRITQQDDIEENDFTQLSDELKRNLADATPEERMELARQGLEDKIAQLNAAIEDVRHQLSDVNNGHASTHSDYEQSTIDL